MASIQMETATIKAKAPRKGLIRRVVAVFLFVLSVLYLHLTIGAYAYLAEIMPPSEEGHLNMGSLIFFFISLFIFLPVLALIFGYGTRAFTGFHDSSGVFWWFSLVCNFLMLCPFVFFFNYDPQTITLPADQESLFYGSFPLAGFVLSLLCL
jgi:uncharacterized membrane protein YhaH (DUF805 family)